MTKTVLCALDINRPEDAHVLKEAARFAALDDAQLDVITVVPDYGASVVGAYFEDHHVKTARDDAKRLLAEFCVAAVGAERNAKIRHVISIGKVYEEVLKAAKHDKADLIVIGANSPDLKDYLLGPNAARVVRHAKSSVYVVR